MTDSATLLLNLDRPKSELSRVHGGKRGHQGRRLKGAMEEKRLELHSHLLKAAKCQAGSTAWSL